MSIKLRLWIVMLLAMLSMALATSSFAQGPNAIVGAWNFTTPAHCTVGCDTGMLVMNVGGTSIGYDNTPATSPNAGTWRATGAFTYRSKTKNAVYNADGTVNVFIVGIGTITLNATGSQFEETGTIKVL